MKRACVSLRVPLLCLIAFAFGLDLFFVFCMCVGGYLAFLVFG